MGSLVEEKRIYVVVAATVQTSRGNIVQPAGRQIAQACHVVSKLRHGQKPTNGYLSGFSDGFESITTIVLQARDSAELYHIRFLLVKNNTPITSFFDTNEVYGPQEVETAVAAFMAPLEAIGTTDYLPLWGK
jgi:hypothetical protein